MYLPVSIIIPTFNEENYLPKLLKSIKNQTLHPKEIIVVDAFSKDKTAHIAKKYGAKVIFSHKWIAGARNLGAQAATQPIILFLDSDVILPSSFLEDAITEFLEKKLDVASCFIKPLSNLRRDKILHDFVNYYIRFTKDFYPHGPGYCIFATKKLHKKIRGFDETVLLAEDHDYVKRAIEYGAFDYLTSHKIQVSVRRLVKEGRFKLVLKYVTAEVQLFLFGKIRRSLFTYEFGSHQQVDETFL